MLLNNLDSTRILIGKQVCFRNAMKYENNVHMISCLHVVRI